MSGDLDAGHILGLFEDLSARLAARDQHAQLFVVGGAAMSLLYDGERSTRDVDAVFEPSQAVRVATREVAEAHGLDTDWLNDGVKGFLPGDDPASVVVFESEHLLVSAASPRYLLATKLFAARAERDLGDAARLFRAAGLANERQAEELLAGHYGWDRLLPKHGYVIAEVVARAARVPEEVRQPLIERLRVRAEQERGSLDAGRAAHLGRDESLER